MPQYENGEGKRDLRALAGGHRTLPSNADEDADLAVRELPFFHNRTICPGRAAPVSLDSKQIPLAWNGAHVHGGGRKVTLFLSNAGTRIIWEGRKAEATR